MNKDSLIVFAVCVVAVLAGAALYFFGGPSEKSTAVDVSFVILKDGNDSGSIKERKNFRLDSMDELVALWRMIYVTDAPPVPIVDFSRSEVLAVFDGQHPTGGYGIKTVSVADTTGINRTITILHTSPGESCMTTEAITSPFQLIIVSKSDAVLDHVDTEEVVPCQ